MQRNIRLLYAFRIVRAFLVVMPIIVPFFRENGLTQTQIYLLETLWAATILVLEVPSGYFADEVGRKPSIVAGAVFSAIGFGIYAVSDQYVQFLAAHVLFGIGYSFISGADSALAFESYAAMNEHQKYRRFEAYSNGASAASEAVASLLGGVLAVVSIRMPITVQAGIYVVLVPLAFLLTEPERVRVRSQSAFRDILRISKFALHDRTEIKWLVFYGAVAGTLTQTMVWITQPLYTLVGVPLGWFGALWAVQLLALGIFSRYAVEYEQAVGKRRALISFIGVGVVAYMVLGFAPSMATLPFLLCFYFVRGCHIPVLQDYVNNLVESDVRATVLSVKNLVQKLMYGALGPVIGLVVDWYSLPAALIFSGFLYGTLGAFVLWKMNRLRIL